MKKNIEKYKNNKLLLILIIITLLSITIGLLFPALLSSSNKKLITNSLNKLLVSIKNNNLNYKSAIISTLSINIIITSLIWILGISIIGILLIVTIFSIKGFILGFSFSSILITYKIKGLFISIIYIIPLVINLFITFILSYYAINFSIIIFNYLFKDKKDIHKKTIKRYIKIYLYSLILIILSSILETYIIPSIIKLFI